MKCWNCLTQNKEKPHRCAHCDQPLKPNAAQKISSKKSLDYLLKEVGSWEFLDAEQRDQLNLVYADRLERLAEAGKQTADWPENDWIPRPPAPISPEEEQSDEYFEVEVELEVAAETEVSVEPDPQPSLAVQKPHTLAPSLPPPPPKPSYVQKLVGEADIRWFHSLGALLVIAAMVGWLRASWDSYGRTLTGFIIASSPFLLHFVAQRIKKTVPLSSRLLSILANLVTPPALLALDVFGALPPSIPGDHYWTFSMLVSAALLSWQAQKTKEKVPLYTGALCAVMAGWSQGALVTAALSLGLGFLFGQPTEDSDSDWQHQRRQVSFYGGSFGALATLLLFDTYSNPALPLVAFTAALIFLHFPNLIGTETTRSRIFLQGALTIIGSILMRAVLGLSPGGVGLYLLFASALFLSVKPESRFALLSARLASAMGFLGLLFGFLGNLAPVVAGQQSDGQAFLRFLFSGVGATYFFMASRRRPMVAQPLLLASLFSIVGGWLHLFFHFTIADGLHQLNDLVGLLAGLVLLEGLLVVGARWLRTEEAALVWQVSSCLTFLSFLFSCTTSLISPSSAHQWPLVLLLHSGLCLAWERNLLGQNPNPSDTQTPQVLARLGLFGAGLAFYQLPLLTLNFRLVLCIAAFQALVFILKGYYRDAAWEAAWAATVVGAFLLNGIHLKTGVVLASFLISYAHNDRRNPSLILSTTLSALWISGHSPEAVPGELYLPALAFFLAGIATPFRSQAQVALGKARYGFDILLVGAVIFGKSSLPGSPVNVLYTLSILGLAVGLHMMSRHRLTKNVVSELSAGVLAGALFCWSMSQSTLESSIIMLLAGLAVGFLSKDTRRWEIANGTIILSLAQFATETHFHFDPVIICTGVLLSEILTMIINKKSCYNSNLALLTVAFVVRPPSTWETLLEELLIASTLLFAARAVQQSKLKSAALSTFYFLVTLDSVIPQRDIDLKIRLLPTAIVLISAGVWKFKNQKNWARPAIQLGVALTAAPALLQFAGGHKMWENFTWTLLLGSCYVGLHFVLKSELGLLFRQAGGFTLIGWAVVSLTRAALLLPWQAATLVIGLMLVGAGVYVEKSKRGQPQSTESTTDNDETPLAPKDS